MKSENNNVTLRGNVVAVEFSHQVNENKFYEGFVVVPRESGGEDKVPVCFKEELLGNLTGDTCLINGDLRSYNINDGEKTKLKLVVFADSAVASEHSSFDDNNFVRINGFLCKKPTYRRTPFGREISDIMVAVNGENKKSNYIPCVCWGKAARFISEYNVGTEVLIEGRFQSREYTKKITETETEKRTAYEVSVNYLAVIESEE